MYIDGSRFRGVCESFDRGVDVSRGVWINGSRFRGVCESSIQSSSRCFEGCVNRWVEVSRGV